VIAILEWCYRTQDGATKPETSGNSFADPKLAVYGSETGPSLMGLWQAQDLWSIHKVSVSS
jgi:hypothetical protein